ncbi:hypothetical protein B0H15DRAFT_955031 [Mycena belliarum]|uniref:Lectin n=1 Tax=Mycena belliarum TaxID=1033014 RepID=A0AAD6XIS9_9AGAR|nr:hypothetical protein B0H15DRAFT_955031 [Mycena belliae]
MAPLFLYALLFVLTSCVISSTALHNVGIEGRATNLDFTSSDWIWTPTTTANAVVAMRKDFTPPLGKALIAADIIVAAANSMELYVNGIFIGSSSRRPRFAHRFCVDLQPSFNVFAVNASTSGSSGGLLFSTLLTYSDGMTDTVVSDPSWRIHRGSPAGFEQLSFDDTAWSVAANAGKYPAIWDAVAIPSNPPVISLARATWIWTDVLPASGKVPAGSRAFRRTFTPAPDQAPMAASILIAADNQYTLYVNGVSIGSGTNWRVAQHYTVNFAVPPAEIVIAVLATNTGSQATTAGVLFAMEVNMQPSGRTDCTAGAFLLSQSDWKSTRGAIPTGFEQPGFDDSAWPEAVGEEDYGGSIWGTIQIAAPAAPITI